MKIGFSLSNNQGFDDVQSVVQLGTRAEELGFIVRRKTIEVEGLCPPCQGRQEARDGA